MDRRVRVRAADRCAAGPAHPPRPHPRIERRELPAQAEQATPAPDINPTGGQPATGLAAGKVRCSPCSRCCAWLRSSHPLRCAPWPGRCQVGTGKQALRSTRKADFKVTLLEPAPPHRRPPIHARDAILLRPPMHLRSGVDSPRYTNLLDPRFPELLADYAEQAARRYPAAEMFTPVNEPLTTARFSCLYGLWYPHTKDGDSFLRALFHECYGTVLAMRRIRRVTPAARLVQTEDIGKTFSTPMLRAQAESQNQRRWLSLDLLCGWVDSHHPWFRAFLAAGVPEAGLRDLTENPCPPDIVGINYYLSTDRFLDQRQQRYPRLSWGGNGTHAYADIEAVRVARADLEVTAAARLREAWRRYRLPLAVTEAHNGCTREEQLRWLADVYNGAAGSRRNGVDLRAVTAWAVIGSIDWHAMLTRRDGHYECGPF